MTKKDNKNEKTTHENDVLIQKVHSKDKKIIQNFHMIKPSQILEVKQNICYLAN